MFKNIQWKHVFISALAIFSMFFGSGNLIFPTVTGQLTKGNYLWGMLGFFTTDICVTLCGVLGLVLVKGSAREYYKELPYPLYFSLVAILLSMLGPFYLIPRCIHVAYGSLIEICPVPLWLFSAFFVSLLFILSLRGEHTVGIIGKYLAPFKIGSLLIIIMGALYMAPGICKSGPEVLQSIMTGMSQGYQTMNLAASVFFSASVYNYLSTHIKGKKKLFNNAALSCVLGLSLIAYVYICLVILGASHAQMLSEFTPDRYLAHIAHITFGPWAVFLVAFTLFFSTLATALILADLYVKFLSKEVFGVFLSCHPDESQDPDKRIPYRIPFFMASLVFTLSIGFVLSLIGFTKLCHFFSYVLYYLYPALIVFAVCKFVYLYKKVV